MKFSFLATLLLCSMASFSQRIKFSETDNTDHICRIGTTSKGFNEGSDSSFAVAIRSENNAVYLQLFTNQSSNIIVAKGDTLMFEMDDNSFLVLHAKAMQVSYPDFKTPLEYRVSLADLQTLYHHSIKSVSYFTASGICKKMPVNASNENGVQVVCGIFFQEYLKSTNAKNTARL